MTAGQSVVRAIILAAGLSERLGRPKMTLMVAGRPLLCWTVEHVLAAGLEAVVVTGHEPEDVAALLPPKSRLTLAVNPDPAAGQAGSLRIGIESIPLDVSWAAVFLGDMPCIWPEVIAEVVAVTAGTEKSIIRPRFDGRPGHPVVFERRWFDDIAGLTGDEGGRAILTAHPGEIEYVDFEGAVPLLDLDTEADIKVIEASLLNKMGREET